MNNYEIAFLKANQPLVRSTMSIIKIYQDYQKGMSVYNACHSPNFNTQWQAFKNENLEFKEEPSIAEA